MKRVWLRAVALALGALGLVAALTVYFSSETVPPCLVSGVGTWKAPTAGTHRYEVVFPDRAACFFAIDDGQKLVGALRLPEAKGISFAAPLLGDIALRTESGVFRFDPRTGTLRRGGLAPFPSDILAVTDDQRGFMYVTRRGFLGFRVLDLRTATALYDISFKGVKWTPASGPNPPAHGLSLQLSNRQRLWVLDAPNGVVRAYDVSRLPQRPPREVAEIPLSKPLTGDENPCSRACRRIGSLQGTADGSYLYVGDVGDVIDTAKREVVANLEALHNSRVHLEVDFSDGRPSYPDSHR
jgi:hypothetical protein